MSEGTWPDRPPVSRTRALPALALLVCLAALALIPPKPAPTETPAAAHESFYGVVTQGSHAQLGERDFARMRRGGVGSVRFLLYWPGVQPTRGPCTPESRYQPSEYPSAGAENHCDWSAVDRVVAGAAANGVEAFPFLYGSPGWVDSNDGFRELGDRVVPVASAEDRAAWMRFVGAAVRRYGPGGAFWSEHPELDTGVPVRRWQIWNEPGSPSYMQPRPSPERYARLLRISAEAIRAADPQAQVVTAGLFNNPKRRLGGIATASFLRRLYSVPGIETSFDLVALHPYGPRLGDVRAQIATVRRIVDVHDDRATELWISELGWASSGPRVGSWVLGRQGQAQALRRAFRIVRSHRERWRIAGVNWFSWRDVPPNQSSCRSCHGTGLLSRGGRPKPAWRSFTHFAAGDRTDAGVVSVSDAER